MATVVLSAAGAAIGGSIGGTLAGLSSVAIGRAVGATLGRVIDQRLLGQGSDVVESGKVDRFRLTNAGDGEPIAQLYGRMRVGGQVIWASDFLETTTVTGGGKGAPSQPKTREYAYSVSLAVALCEGEILGVGRVWADGEEIAPDDLNLRVYTGGQDQMPDPTMEAIEGTGQVPAYRGTAYVVMENLGLEPFGNRVPQFSFEVIRGAPEQDPEFADDLAQGIRGVALMPGTGEYALASSPVNYTDGKGGLWSANINSPAGKPDLLVSLDALTREVPGCEATSLIVSWFGDDLRCGTCSLRPKMERRDYEGKSMPWSVSGLSRSQAEEIAQVDGRPVYGGTPADAAVIEAIAALKSAGQAVMFYPFILMDQLEGNTLPDPYSEETGQAVLPWRGRITLSKAPGMTGSPDGTVLADAEVDAFFGTVTASDFSIGTGSVTYTGPNEWSFSRFILHYAALCAASGGVEAFCIGSEMRGLTWIRGAGNAFVAVARLRALAAEVRVLLGAETKISYAADWSEYFGYNSPDGNRYFHLDPLWADANIDFIGIDNYMPLSDWRDGSGHADADWETIYNLDYLKANIEGGEGYDWFYGSPEAAEAQNRMPITDGAYDEPWIWRFKDIRNWWENQHYERIGGVRQSNATAWIPQSKPIWFTEFGCAAIDKGTNEPNKFLDPKSSESRLPKYSNGARDDLMQRQYYLAMTQHWGEVENNPISDLYGAEMINMDRAFAWAWDARPYPFFPNAIEQWSDGENYPRGHWLNGRTGARSLASVVREVCERAGVGAIDVSALYGMVSGYIIDDVSDARSVLQPLMLRYGFDAIERDGVLVFRMRQADRFESLDPDLLALHPDLEGSVEQVREAEAEMSGRIRLRFVEADANFESRAEEAVLSDEATHAVATSELPLALTRSEGLQVTERWLNEARISRETVRFALPPSRLDVGAGDVVQLPDGGLYRIDRSEMGPMQLLEGVRVDPETYVPSVMEEELGAVRSFAAPVPLTSFFMDLPLLTGDEVPHTPYVATTASAWPGTAAVYQSNAEDDFRLNAIINARATIGRTETVLEPACMGVFDNGADLEVQLISGTLSSVSEAALLNGANLAAIGDGTPNGWEVFQFANAQVIAPGRYLLRRRLRGQLGTEAYGDATHPEGSWFVLLDGAPTQIELARNLRRVAQTYRVGPARRPFDDPSYSQVIHAFDGNGLRPYAPVHLRVVEHTGALHFDWIRRTRRDGDSWEVSEVPLAEETERYRVRVVQNNTVLREEEVTQPTWSYSAPAQATDGAARPFDITVAQVSAEFGPGPAGRVTVLS